MTNLPSSLTTNGTSKFNFLEAFIKPFAIVAQLTIPPKTLTKIAFTDESTKIIQISINNFKNIINYIFLPNVNSLKAS